jgi:ABC-type Na+ efflux pump permease subunit
MVYIFFNYTFIPFFMIVPVMVASIIASNGIVGEKERHTLETLLYTPLTNREFLVGKIASAFIPAGVISFIAFAGYFLVVNLCYFFLRGTMLVTSPIWIPSILLLSPGVSLLGLGITLLVSLKAKSFMEAQQIAGVVVVPFLILIVVQLTGVVVFKPFYVILFGLFLFLLSGFIILRIGPRFDREEILSTL